MSCNVTLTLMMEGVGFQPSCDMMLRTAQACSVCVGLLLLMAAVLYLCYLISMLSVSTQCVFNAGQGDRVSQIHNQVEDVKRIMLDNVEKVLERGERLDDLLSKTENLETHVSIVSRTMLSTPCPKKIVPFFYFFF